MQSILIASVLLILPFLGVVLLRTNAALLFFVLMGGTTLQAHIDKNVVSFASSLLGKGNDTRYVSLAILAVPLVAVTIAFRKTVSTKLLILHALLALGVGVSALKILPGFFPQAVQASIYRSAQYIFLEPYISVVMAATFVVSVVLLWLSRPRHEGAHSKKKHH